MISISKKVSPIVSIILITALLFSLAVFIFTHEILSYNSDVIHGFRLIKQSYIDSIQSTVFQYEHIKSGAKLIFLKNSDNNKTFSINFRTPPEDDSGVNHIIEHCLLDGSEDYPVKSIVSAMKTRSMSIYFNAYTASDVTGYIAASKNEKDYQNLLRVLMDAVFHPNVLNNKNIFLQEAGHYEIDSPESELSYNGVVYNEMKGVSTPCDILYSKIYENLMHDSVYRWNSGGDPAKIPDLTYEKLIETYKRYYHPSNSYIYLYGNLDIDKTLDILNSEFLGNFKRAEVKSGIEPQPPLANSVKAKYEYSVNDETTSEKGTYLSWSCVLEKAGDPEVLKAFDMLATLLFSEGSPFRKALSDKGFNNISYSIDTLLQPVFTILCENCESDKSNEFAAVIENELKRMVENGIDKSKISSLLRSYELKPYQETLTLGINRGVLYNKKVMTTWLYDVDPFTYIDYSINIDILKKELTGGYFSGLITQYMLKNKHKAVIALEPTQELAEDVTETERKRLQAYKESLSADQINTLIKQSEDLKKWQSTPESAETLSKMPILELSDIDKKSICYLEPFVDTIDGTTILYTPEETYGISCINLYFDTTTVPQEKIQFIKLLEAILGSVGTEKYGSDSILNEIQSSTTGELIFSAYPFGNIEQTDRYSPKMMVSVSALDKDLSKTIDLLNQIMVRSVFDKAKLENIIYDQKNMTEAIATSNYMAMVRLNSYISDKEKYYESLFGFPYYEFISKLETDFAKNPNEIINNIMDVYHDVFNKNNLILGFVGGNEAYGKFRSNFDSLFEGMNDSKLKTYHYSFSDTYINEGLISNRNVNSIVKGYNLKKLGYDYSGKMAVLESVLNEYLHNEIREKGGAYEGNAKITRDGNILFISGKDPSISETLSGFNGAVSYLRNFKADEREMTNYIIGTIARMDEETDSNILNKARESQQLYIMGGSQQLYLKEREEILSTTVDDIRSLAEVIKAVMDQNCYCVAGSEADINSRKDLFSRIVKLEVQN